MRVRPLPRIVMTELADLLPAVCRIAIDAGKATLPIYHSDFDVQTKDDHSPLTQADLAAHRVIQQGLAELTPEWPQLSEEAADIDFDTRCQWDRYWLVDPLDGTREFVKRNDQFTVNIALINRQQPVLGVVYAPVYDTLWYGAQGIGAFKQEKEEQAAPMHTTAVRTGVPRVLVSRSHRSPEIDTLLNRMPDYEPITMGSSLKFCLIAEGAADFYPRLGPTSEWDTGAAHAVLQAAGGQVTDIQGQPLRYNTKDSLLNPHFLAYGDSDHNWASYLPD